MHLSNPARAVLLFVSGAVMSSSQAASASAYTCFDADGGNLKTAVGQYIEGTWGDGGEYGPIEEWGGVPKMWKIWNICSVEEIHSMLILQHGIHPKLLL